MKKIITIVLAFFAVQNANAQATSIQWQKSLGSDSTDYANSIQQTSDGGYIVGGYSNLYYNPNLSLNGRNGSYRDYLVKLNDTSGIAWQQWYNNGYYGVPLGCRSIRQTFDGGYISGGSYGITKMNSLGVAQWNRMSCTPYNTGSYPFEGTPSIQQTSDKGYVLIYGTYGIQKIDSSGVCQWSIYGASGNGCSGGAFSVSQTSDKGYIVAGWYSFSNPNTTGCPFSLAGNGGSLYNYSAAYGDNMLMFKLDSTGIPQWESILAGNNSDIAYSIQQTTDGGYIVAGSSNSTLGYSGNHGGLDMFVAKLSNLGSPQWTKMLGGTGDDTAYSVQQTTDGGYIVAGSTTSNDGDVTGNHGGSDMWVVNLSNTGNIRWQKTLGGSQADDAKEIQQTTDGGYIVAGSTKSIDGDVTGRNSTAFSDAWVVKLAPCINSTTTLFDTACYHYTFNGHTYTTSGIYRDTLTNAIGCDSIITLNLTIYQASYSSINVGVQCDSFVFNGHTYTTSGIKFDTLTSIHGCDSVIGLLGLIIHHSSSRTLNLTACDNYTFNGTLLTQSGTYFDTIQNIQQCDSFITLNLTINHTTTDTTIISDSVCNSYSYNGTTYTQSGTYYAVLANSQGCDSVVKLILSINSSSSTQTASICEGNNYNFNGHTYSQSGIYYDTLQNIQGCDSIITFILSVSYLTSTQTKTVCGNYSLNGVTITQSGIYHDTLQNAQGCDSVITLQLTINSLPHLNVVQNGNELYTQTYSTYQWLLNGEPITGATSQTYTAIESGDYTVIVTNINGCSNTSAVRHVSIAPITGINEIIDNGLSIVPNPSNGKFTITSTSATQGIIEVYSITGTKVLSQTVSSLTKANLDISNQAKGVYVVKVSNAENVWTQRVIIE